MKYSIPIKKGKSSRQVYGGNRQLRKLGSTVAVNQDFEDSDELRGTGMDDIGGGDLKNKQKHNTDAARTNWYEVRP